MRDLFRQILLPLAFGGIADLPLPARGLETLGDLRVLAHLHAPGVLLIQQVGQLERNAQRSQQATTD